MSRAKQPNFASLYFNPSVTLATRVRIEVLKALSTRVTSSQQLAYCTYNGPRPKLSVGPAVGFPGRRTALNYAPAIKKYGFLLDDQFLEKAYARAQMFFSGMLLLCYLISSWFIFSFSVIFQESWSASSSCFVKRSLYAASIKELAKVLPMLTHLICHLRMLILMHLGEGRRDLQPRIVCLLPRDLPFNF